MASTAVRVNTRSGVGALLGVAALGITALLVRQAGNNAEKRFPAQGKFIEVEGVKLHYLEAGSGSPVILLHGNGAMAEDFGGAGVMGRLAQRHRVIAFDRPGFGYSERPRGRSWAPDDQAQLLLQAVRQLRLENAVVVGHSWGAMVALAMALEAPSQVQALVLASGYYFPSPRLDAVLLGGPGIPVVGDVMRYTISPIVSRMILGKLFKKIFAPRPVPESFVKALPREMLLRPSHLRAAGAESLAMIPAAASLSKRYGELRVPLTILAGEGDEIVKAGQAERLHAAVPDSTLDILPGIGHMLHYAAPDAIVHAVERYTETAAAEPTL